MSLDYAHGGGNIASSPQNKPHHQTATTLGLQSPVDQSPF